MLWAQVSFLLYWSFFIGQVWVGLGVSMLLILCLWNKKGFSWNHHVGGGSEKNSGKPSGKASTLVSDGQLQSLSDFCFVFVLVMLIVINNEVDRPIEAFIYSLQWSPLMFLPWVFVRFLGDRDSVSLKLLFVPLRYPKLGMSRLGNKVIDLTWLSVFLCVMGASTCDEHFEPYYYPSLSAIGLVVIAWQSRFRTLGLKKKCISLLSMSLVWLLGYGIMSIFQETEDYLKRRRLSWIQQKYGQSSLLLQSSVLGQRAHIQLNDGIVLRMKRKEGRAGKIMDQSDRDGDLATTNDVTYLKSAHYDQWLGRDTWVLSEQKVDLAGERGQWHPRHAKGGGHQNDHEGVIVPTYEMWYQAEGAFFLPFLKGAQFFKSHTLSHVTRVGTHSIKVECDREWFKLDLATSSNLEARESSVQELNVDDLERYLYLDEDLEKELTSWLFFEEGRGQKEKDDHSTEAIDRLLFKLEAGGMSCDEAVAWARSCLSGFKYDLDLEGVGLGDDPILKFLREQKSGHCEYYATSGTLMLRAMGIPARYVTGYMVKEFDGEWWSARGQDAHAWIEAWDGSEWVRVELTPSANFSTSFFRPVKDLWSRMWMGWNNWRFGGEEDLVLKWAPYLLILVLIYFSFRLLVEWKKNQVADKGIKASSSGGGKDPGFYRFEERMRKAGFQRLESETYEQWFQRLADSHRESMGFEDELSKLWNRWAWSELTDSEYSKTEAFLNQGLSKP